jgi:hypothetical protein
MDETLKALAVNVPAAVAVIATVWMFLRAEEKREERREANAKSKDQENKSHELMMGQMWATHIDSLMMKTDETFKLLANALSTHEKASKERYDRMQITQDLVKMARAEAEKKMKKT